ncbi:RsmE family RNA methyltransferase [Candidatus Latescibacterota bacterium]
MQNFIAEPDSFTTDTVSLTGEEYYHATRSSRIKTGDIIGVTDGRGKRVEARITSIDSRSLTAVIERDVSGIGEPLIHITVALSLIKPSRFELAAEKCTEIGARRFLPLIARRCECKPERFKFDRLAKIIRQAAKQSGRSWVPDISAPVTPDNLLKHETDAVLAAIKTAEKRIPQILETIPGVRMVTLVIGPEGDFTDEERECFISGGAIPFTLGRLMLRSETAAITATAAAASFGK